MKKEKQYVLPGFEIRDVNDLGIMKLMKAHEYDPEMVKLPGGRVDFLKLIEKRKNNKNE